LGDIHGARVTPQGVVLDSLVITSEPTVQSAPTVAYGNGLYVVSWTDNRVEFPDIYCARILPDGTVLDEGGFPVHSDSAYQMGSNVCFGDSNFLAVWSSFKGSEFSLSSARITPTGIVLDSTRITISQGGVSKFAPGIAFDGVNYMVQWDDSRLNPPEYDQWAARISPQGVVLDTAGLPVDTSAGNQYNSSIGFLDHCYLGSWTDYSSGEGDLYGRRLSTEGTWLDTVTITICKEIGHQETPAVFQDIEKFIVAWRDSRNGVMNADLYATFVDSGAVGVDEVTGEQQRRQRLSLCVNPNPFIEKVIIHTTNGNTEKHSENVQLCIFDACGRKVRDFIFHPSSFILASTMTWDGCNDRGEIVPPGIYFFVLRNRKDVVTKKVLKIG
jgi:hypothetical protein